MVLELLSCEPHRGHIFYITNAQRNSLKQLLYEVSGLRDSAKRLERCRFRWPKAEGAKVLLNHHELTLLLDGIDLIETRRRPWHRVSTAEEQKPA